MNSRSIILLCSVGLLLPAMCEAQSPTATASDQLAKQFAAEQVEEITTLYRELHLAPELSLKEANTAARMAAELRALGAEVQIGIGGHGLVGVFTNGPGKTLLLRADMDALPVVEETGREYASQVRTKNDRGQSVGVMHACGHDIHMSNLIGVARMLAAHPEAWQGTVVVLMQPAEEIGEGARAMLNDGLLALIPRPDFAVALHVSADTAAGEVGFTSGFSCANVDSVDITIHGRGGHGAYPETTIDPIVIAAKLVLDLQTIVSREIKATEPAVVTVGAIEGGTKHNVIGDSCHLQLTVRSYAPEVRQHLQEAIERKAKAAALSAGAPEPEIVVDQGTPSLYNDPELVAKAEVVAKRLLGDERVQRGQPTMGGEDFSRYGQAGIPICMFKLGVVNQERLDQYASDGTPPPSLHSPKFYPDPEPALRTGIATMGAIALDLLAPKSESAE
ncbi:M20 metallopeptidase family protein [Aeoliella mucimassa]|uniref:N-acetyldiaminopimelate deacetylase n=1 Tax=Aeoliella mucimassa TaxID=2527972 RepID=A0A518AT67_9BACT|nr:amidohydrolase [Aeoliella mucimassa]QDU57887.1 N-acetyldiaminopimelate deacetylase [Aeoliella mucimassa]